VAFYNHFEGKEDLADTSVKPLDRLRGHFEFLRDEVVEFGSARGCLLGNFGTEIIDHSDGPT
jgi:TetR/AcrR family transcriptional repressor of nem operon